MALHETRDGPPGRCNKGRAPPLTDVYIDKVLPLGVGAGHRVGIQNSPAGGRTTTADRRRVRGWKPKTSYADRPTVHQKLDHK